MKTIPEQMQADLDGRATHHCYGWQIALTNGTVMGFTDHDCDLLFEGVVFKALTGMDASAIASSKNLQVDDMDAIGYLSDTSISADDIEAGLFDNAMVTVYKFDWLNTDNHVVMMRGPISTIAYGEVGYKAQVQSTSTLMDLNLSRHYAPKCQWVLGQGVCGLGVNLQTYAYSTSDVVVSRVLSPRTFETTSADVLARADGFFSEGSLQWATGVNEGVLASIKHHANRPAYARFELLEKPSRNISVGDTFTAYAGCSKTAEICHAKFNNITNFGGFPRMPGSNFILNYPSKGGRNDGGSMY